MRAWLIKIIALKCFSKHNELSLNYVPSLLLRRATSFPNFSVFAAHTRVWIYLKANKDNSILLVFIGSCLSISDN